MLNGCLKKSLLVSFPIQEHPLTKEKKKKSLLDRNI